MTCSGGTRYQSTATFIFWIIQLVNSKAKGSSFERIICKQLSLWVSSGTHEDCFWRSAMSGGRATVALKTGKQLRRQAGDITATAPEGEPLTSKFFVECKHVRNLALESFIMRDKGLLAEFWRTATREAKNHGRAPMIIARQNRCADILITTTKSLRCPKAKPIFTHRSGYGVWLLSEVLTDSFAEVELRGS